MEVMQMRWVEDVLLCSWSHTDSPGRSELALEVWLFELLLKKTPIVKPAFTAKSLGNMVHQLF